MAYIERRNGRYRARYRDTLGKQRSKTFTRKGDAQRFLREVQVDIERGHWLDRRGANITVKQWSEEFLSFARRLEITTQQTYRRDLVSNSYAKFGDAGVLKNSGANGGALAVNEREDRGSASVTIHTPNARVIGVTVARPATDARLVGNDDVASEQGAIRAKAHCLAQTMAKRPCRVSVELVLPFDLAGRNTILGTGELKGDEQPGSNGHLASMHDRARKHAELLTALRAFPETPLSQFARRGLAANAIARLEEVVILDASAMRANRLSMPAHFLKQFVSGGLSGDFVGQAREADFHIAIVSEGCITRPGVHKYSDVS